MRLWFIMRLNNRFQNVQRRSPEQVRFVTGARANNKISVYTVTKYKKQLWLQGERRKLPYSRWRVLFYWSNRSEVETTSPYRITVGSCVGNFEFTNLSLPFRGSSVGPSEGLPGTASSAWSSESKLPHLYRNAGLFNFHHRQWRWKLAGSSNQRWRFCSLLYILARATKASSYTNRFAGYQLQLVCSTIRSGRIGSCRDRRRTLR